MKKTLCLLLSLFILASSVLVFAQEQFAYEENFTFDEFDVKSANNDEMTLMEIEESVKAKLEEKLTKAWKNMDTEVSLFPDVKIHKNDIASVYASVFFENPQYYYVARSFSGTLDSDGYLGKLTKLSYTINDKAAIEKTWEEIDKATEEILFYISPEMTDFEKVMTVHDYMDLHYVYDIEDIDQTYLIMLDKRGVCAAYSEAFQHMMNVLGIECTLVSSDEMGHIWNMVKLDERWYHADLTWDDPVPDQYAQVCHEYMLLSAKAIKELGHTGFTAPYSAISTIYNNAPWHDDKSSLVTVGGIMYRHEGNNLIDENDKVIYKNLDGGDGRWNVSETSYAKNAVWAGLCEVNNILYFNTDTGIYSYNPKTEETKCVLEEYGISGIYADGNTIHYSEYDFGKQQFVKKGDIAVEKTFVKSAAFENGKAVIRMYNDSDKPAWIISKGENFKIQKIDPNRAGMAQFENGSEQTIFIWKNSLEPVFETFTVSE